LLIPVAGGETKVLGLSNFATDADNLLSTTWTSDGRSLLVLKRRPGQVDEIWQVPIDGGTPRKLDLGPSGMFAYLSIHPDGKRFAFTTGEKRQPGGEIWMLENFLPSGK
jgi:Tol biopolymer transport system component